MNKKLNKVSIAFFGTSLFSVIVLDELLNAGIIPALIVTTPDKPQGRKLILTPSPVKLWAEKHSVPLLQPEKLNDTFVEELRTKTCTLFIVASYGKIIPKSVLDIPKFGALNVHPSLLPKLRGASPLQTSILENMQETGVTIMKMDEQMDHGPIVAQEKITVEPWPVTTLELEEILGKLGGKLLAETIEPWISGELKPQEQDHTQATFTKKIEKSDGLLDLTADPYKNFLKIKAYSDWPTAYFFLEKNLHTQTSKKIRVVITEAEFKNNVLEIKKVIPESKKEMSYSDFIRS